jgi:hypothetical protein
MLTDTLINPTPFDVKIDYTAGVTIRIPGDGRYKLDMEQLDDYRTGKPGSEQTTKDLQYHGLFILDGDRSYDSQAIEALKASYKAKNYQLDEFTKTLRKNRVSMGAAVDDTSMEEALNLAGYGRIIGELEMLKNRIDVLQEVVDADGSGGAITSRLDPKRTCFITKPPKEFPSETALKIFLSENPDIKKQHEAFVKEASSE